MSYLISSLNIYFNRKFLFWFFCFIVGTFLVILLFEAVEVTRKSMLKDVPLNILIQISLCRVPNLLSLLIPIICFFSFLGCFMRLHQTNNIVILQGFGVSKTQFLMGYIFSIIIIAVCDLLVYEQIRSTLFSRASHLEEKFLQKKSYSIALNENGLWLREKIGNKSSIIQVGKHDAPTKTFLDIKLYQVNSKGVFIKHYRAKKALLKENYWELHDGFSIDSENNFLSFKIQEVPSKLILQNIINASAPKQSLSFSQIPEFVKMLRNSGINPISYLVEWHGKIASYGMIFGYMIIASVFCFRNTRNMQYMGIISLSVIAAFLLYFFENIMKAYAIAEKAPVIFAAWVPVILTILTALWLKTIYARK